MKKFILALCALFITACGPAEILFLAAISSEDDDWELDDWNWEYKRPLDPPTFDKKLLVGYWYKAETGYLDPASSTIMTIPNDQNGMSIQFTNSSIATSSARANYISGQVVRFTKDIMERCRTGYGFSCETVRYEISGPSITKKNDYTPQLSVESLDAQSLKLKNGDVYWRMTKSKFNKYVSSYRKTNWAIWPGSGSADVTTGFEKKQKSYVSSELKETFCQKWNENGLMIQIAGDDSAGQGSAAVTILLNQDIGSSRKDKSFENLEISWGNTNLNKGPLLLVRQESMNGTVVFSYLSGLSEGGQCFMVIRKEGPKYFGKFTCDGLATIWGTYQYERSERTKYQSISNVSGSVSGRFECVGY